MTSTVKKYTPTGAGSAPVDYATAAASVVDRVAYIDTVGVLMDRPPPKGFLGKLQRHCGSASFQPLKPKVDFQTGEVLPGLHRFHWWLSFNQPTAEAVTPLRELWGLRDCCMSRVDVALDLITPSRAAAAALGKWVKRCLVRPWHRGKRMGRSDVGNTTYWSEDTWGVSAPLVYDDLRSKVTGQPAVHVEYRIKSAKTVRRVLQVREPDDLLDLCGLEFWQKRLVLEEFDLSQVGRHARGRGNAKKPDVKTFGSIVYDRDLRAGQILAKVAGHQINSPVHPSAQAVRQLTRWWPGLKPERLLTRVDPSPFLPPAGKLLDHRPGKV